MFGSWEEEDRLSSRWLDRRSHLCTHQLRWCHTSVPTLVGRTCRYAGTAAPRCWLHVCTARYVLVRRTTSYVEPLLGRRGLQLSAGRPLDGSLTTAGQLRLIVAPDCPFGRCRVDSCALNTVPLRVPLYTKVYMVPHTNAHGHWCFSGSGCAE